MHLRIKNGEKASCCIDLRSLLLFQTFLFFIWTRPNKCEPKDSSRGRSTAQIQLDQAKVTAYPYKSFGQAFSKACGNPKGKARGRLRRGEIPQRILTAKAKLTVKPSKMKKSKSAMQLKRVKPREVTKITILVKRLICIALILNYQAKATLLQICERSRANL